jgi:hypothetical protein
MKLEFAVSVSWHYKNLTERVGHYHHHFIEWTCSNHDIEENYSFGASEQSLSHSTENVSLTWLLIYASAVLVTAILYYLRKSLLFIILYGSK